MRLARRTLAGVVALLLALVTGSAYADGLFLPVTAQDVPAMPATSSGLSAQPRGSDRQGAWERHVRVARHDLDHVRDVVQHGDAGQMLLNVRPGTSLDVVVERTVRIERGYTLSGRIAGDAMGFVTLVAHEEAVAASIWTPRAAYELAYLGGGIHALREVTNAPHMECGGVLPSESSMRKTIAQSDTDDGSVVDILVLWTPAAEERYGGESQALSRIDMSIAYTNDAFERSGAFVSLNLVGAERVDYSEGNEEARRAIWTAMTRLVDPDDGYMDHVHDRRSALGADLVYLLVDKWGGLNAGDFGVGSGGRTFAHEVGHSFGILHQRFEPDTGVLPGRHQHGFTAIGVQCEETIMSYGRDCHGVVYGVPFYASPWRYSPYDGRALGESSLSKKRGARGPADAVLTLNRNRHRVANLLPSRKGGSER